MMESQFKRVKLMLMSKFWNLRILLFACFVLFLPKCRPRPNLSEKFYQVRALHRRGARHNHSQTRNYLLHLDAV